MPRRNEGARDGRACEGDAGHRFGAHECDRLFQKGIQHAQSIYRRSASAEGSFCPRRASRDGWAGAWTGEDAGGCGETGPNAGAHGKPERSHEHKYIERDGNRNKGASMRPSPRQLGIPSCRGEDELPSLSRGGRFVALRMGGIHARESYLSIYLSIYTLVCLSVCLSVCLCLLHCFVLPLCHAMLHEVRRPTRRPIARCI